ncbi:AcvB/VirJ family lysyl-phosphatidylglycerol hydrolase [Stenotrophomonas sp.]|uniref:virulence factor family protein n=1 Tax=Stenotrophomonas sp. TaxID=69392 RepID=UPI0028AB6CBB|nr:AcvB/VirJ family lysyl-phosphatidylglycerol hydrolase [Stenotrophomonas sp.]
MRRASVGRGLGVVLGLVSAVVSMAACAAPQQVSHGRFHDIPIHAPDGHPQRVVVWFDGGREQQRTRQRIEALRAHGALVAEVDVARLRQALAREGGGDCAFGAGDVENFSRWFQAYLHVPGYHLPLVAGDGAGAELAYAVAAQADTQVFAGLLTTDFCPDQTRERKACGAGVSHGRLQPAELNFPWLNAAGDRQCAAGKASAFVRGVAMGREFQRTASGDDLPGLLAAAQVIGAQKGVSLAPPPDDLNGLPVVEIPSPVPGDTLAIFVSGDGGWAGLDKEVAAALSEGGVSVVGVDSLRYFWTERTPEGFARDLERIARHYSTQWQRKRLVLVGFSQGADVLPAAINQLDPATRDAVAMIGLMSVGRTADYEFHVSNWLGGGGGGLPIAPEIARLPADRTLCLYGQDDDDALCPDVPAAQATIIALPGDHHFKGDYDRLAKTLLEHLAARSQRP